MGKELYCDTVESFSADQLENDENIIKFSNESANLLKNMRFPVIIFDTELILLCLSDAARELSGNHLNKSNAMSELKTSLNINDLEQMILDCITCNSEKEIDTKIHSGKWYKIRITPYYNESGEVDGAILTFFDIHNIKIHDDSLRESKIYAKAIIETIREPLVLLDCNLCVISANRQFYKIFKLVKGEVENKIIYDLNNGEWDISDLRRLLEQIMTRTSYYSNFEMSCNFSRIGEKTLLINARKIEFNNENRYSILLVLEDITYRAYVDKVCEKLIERDDQYLLEVQRRTDEIHTVLSSIAEPVIIYNKHGVVINANSASVELLGFDPVNMDHAKIVSMLGSESIEGEKISIEDLISSRAIQGETIKDASFKFTNACGEEKTVICSAAPIVSGGENIGVVVVWHDITERAKMDDIMKIAYVELEDRVAQRTSDLLKANKRLNQEILKHREANELLERVFSCTNFLIAYLDTNFNFIRVNKSYAEVEHKRPEYYVGKNHFDLFPNDENKEIFTRVVMTGDTYTTYAKPFVYANSPELGVTYWDFSLHPIKNTNNHVEGLVLFLVDVTRRKQIEWELMKTQKELSDAKRLSDIGTLAATVAHELRNPLGVIQTATYNISRKRLNPLIDKHIANIEKKVMESNQIINNLLIYSRIKKPHYESVDLYNLIEECVNTMKSRYKKWAITVEKKYLSIKDIKVEIDPLHFKEILNNILNNSFQAMKEGKGKIDVSTDMNDGKQIKIRIKDDGIGISQEDLQRVFEPFFTKKSKGTGLGLVICKELVNLHNGEIYVDSEEGTGTSVSIVFPVKRDFNEK